MNKMMMTLAALLLIACGQAQEEQDLKLNGKLKEETNQSICLGTTPAGYSIFTKSWIADYSAGNGLAVQDEVKIEPNAYTIIRTCTYGNTSVPVIARVNASVNGSSIQTLSNDQAERKIQVGNTEQTCDIEIKAGQNINYTFVGPCLKTISTGSSQTLIPR